MRAYQDIIATALSLRKLGIKEGYLNIVMVNRLKKLPITQPCPSLSCFPFLRRQWCLRSTSYARFDQDDTHGHQSTHSTSYVRFDQDDKHGHQSTCFATESKTGQDPAQFQASSVPWYLHMLYRHRIRIVMPASFAMLASVVVGLVLADVISILALVVTLPTIIAYLAHRRCLTSDGAAYPVLCSVFFAVTFFFMIFFSVLFMFVVQPNLGESVHGKWINSIEAASIIFVAFPVIFSFSLYWTFRNNNWRSLKEETSLLFLGIIFAILTIVICMVVFMSPTVAPKRIPSTCLISPQDCSSCPDCLSIIRKIDRENVYYWVADYPSSIDSLIPGTCEERFDPPTTGVERRYDSADLCGKRIFTNCSTHSVLQSCPSAGSALQASTAVTASSVAAFAVYLIFN